MRSKYLFVVFLFLIGFLVGMISLKLWQGSANIPSNDANFVKACYELNGKNFSFNTLKHLQGTVFASCGGSGCGGVVPLQESHIKEYKQLIASCGRDKEAIEALPIGISPFCDSTHCEYSPYSCLEGYHKNIKNGQVEISTDGTIGVTQGEIDGNWECNLKSVNNSIKASARYIPAY